MNKKIFYSFIATIILFTLLSCTDEDRTTNWVSGGEEVAEGTQVPFKLGQNYPNPFNPSTVIYYGLAKELYVELEVYSEDWVKVATLVNDVKEAGYYEITFDAGNLASGVYYYTMTCEGITQINEMKLVK